MPVCVSPAAPGVVALGAVDEAGAKWWYSACGPNSCASQARPGRHHPLPEPVASPAFLRHLRRGTSGGRAGGPALVALSGLDRRAGSGSVPALRARFAHPRPRLPDRLRSPPSAASLKRQRTCETVGSILTFRRPLAQASAIQQRLLQLPTADTFRLSTLTAAAAARHRAQERGVVTAEVAAVVPRPGNGRIPGVLPQSGREDRIFGAGWRWQMEADAAGRCRRPAPVGGAEGRHAHAQVAPVALAVEHVHALTGACRAGRRS